MLLLPINAVSDANQDSRHDPCKEEGLKALRKEAKEAGPQSERASADDARACGVLSTRGVVVAGEALDKAVALRSS